MSSKTTRLKDLSVLITRPPKQASSLCEQLQTEGAACTVFPTLEIVHFSKQPNLKHKLATLYPVDIAVFLSQHAVTNVLAHWSPLNAKQIASIGPTTRNALISQGLSVELMPKNSFTSEDLLSLPQMLDVRDKQIAIFSGEGGRTLIADTLTKRGANVTKIDCYRRIQPQTDMSAAWQNWQQAHINLIISYSGESLSNLCAMVGDQHRAWLISCPLLVISKRMVNVAKELGFQEILQANDVTDTAIVNTLIDWRST